MLHLLDSAEIWALWSSLFSVDVENLRQVFVFAYPDDRLVDRDSFSSGLEECFLSSFLDWACLYLEMSRHSNPAVNKMKYVLQLAFLDAPLAHLKAYKFEKSLYFVSWSKCLAREDKSDHQVMDANVAWLLFTSDHLHYPIDTDNSQIWVSGEF